MSACHLARLLNLPFSSLWSRGLSSRTHYRQWLESASDSILTESVLTILPDGGEFRVPRWQIVLHAINHTTFHRGQIVTMLRALGVQPPNTDLTCYHASQG